MYLLAEKSIYRWNFHSDWQAAGPLALVFLFGRFRSKHNRREWYHRAARRWMPRFL